MDETIYRSAFNAAKVEDIFGRALLKRELSQNDYNALGSGIDPRTFYMIMSDNQLTDVYVGTHRLPIAGNAINVSWGTPGTDSIPLTVNGVTKNLLTSHQSLSGYATEAFVNSSIATATATFRGTSAAGLTEAQFLSWANGLTHDDNDYVFWNTVDSSGNVQFKRYKYTGLAWLYEYTLNNSSFTAAQWNAINSGITSGLVANIHTHANKSVLDNISSAAVSNWGTAYSHSQTSGNPHATTFAQLQSKPTSLQGYGITDAVNKAGDTMTGNLTMAGGGNVILIRNFSNSVSSGWARELAQISVDGNAKFYIGALGEYTVGASDNGIAYAYIGCNSYNGLNLRISPTYIKWGDNVIYHSGNSNQSTIDWACRKLTASGVISAAAIKTAAIRIECSADGSVVSGYSGEVNRFGGTLCLQYRGNDASNPTGDIAMCANGGNVGIGVTAPTEKLQVAGNIISDNNTRSIGTSGIPWGEIHAGKWYPNPNDTTNYIEYTGGGWLVHGNIRSTGEMAAAQ